MNVQDLMCLLGPGVHDISGDYLIISDGSDEIKVLVEKGTLTVTVDGFKPCDGTLDFTWIDAKI